MTLLNEINAPLVSVIIPTFNYGHFILSAIKSITDQDYSQIEILVIDDGSTDNTQQLLSSISGITYVRQDNQGLSSARNHGLRRAQGKYLQFLDADDMLGPTSIRKRVEFLESKPNHSAVFCRSAFFYKKTYPTQVSFLYREWRQPEKHNVDIALYYFNIAPPHAFLVRKSTIDKYNLEFDQNLRACEDYDFWFRLAIMSGVPATLQTTWVYYRQHPNSMSRSLINQYRHDAELCKRILTTSYTSGAWLGKLPAADYLSAMFAASLVTARRLWHFDRPSFPDFLSTCVIPIQSELERAQLIMSNTAASKWYLAKARHTLNRMRIRDRSLTQSQHKELHTPIPYFHSFFLSAFIQSYTQLSARIQIRLLKLDLLNVAILSFGKILYRFH